MPLHDDVSHGDIYHKLGSLEGKLEALLLSIGERRDDINGIHTRLRTIEHRVAWAMGATVVVSLLVPHVFKAFEVRVHPDPPAQQRLQ